MSRPSPHDSYIHSENENEELDDGKIYYSKSETKLENTKFCKLSLKAWNAIFFILNISTMFLLLCSFGTPRWVEQGDTEHFWRGGLLKCTGCNGKFSQMTYSDIKNEACDKYSGYCKTFTKLYIAGICLLLCCIVYFILVLVWSVILVLENYGKNVKNRFRSLVVAGSPFVLMVGIVSWNAISGAGYSGDCYDDFTSRDKAKSVCAIDGPVILISSLLLSVITSSLYYVLKYFVKNSLENKIQPYVA